MFNRLCVIGVGLIGGSIARAARQHGLSKNIVGYGRQQDIHNLETAKRLGVIDEFYLQIEDAVKGADALIMAAAVADYMTETVSETKIKKDSPALTIKLARTPDILAGVKGSFVRVGFAAESEDLVANARKKLTEKGLDLIVANDITGKDSGFGADTSKVTIIDKNGNIEDLPMMSKREVADKILDRVRETI